jgi:hypothetical protein
VGPAIQPDLDASEDSLVSYYDQRLVNEAAAVDQCLKLGGVILKPQSQSKVGFAAPTPPSQDDQRPS